MFCFRIRFRLGSRITINSTSDSLVLVDPALADKDIWLKPAGRDNSFSDAVDLVLLGRPFNGEDDAAEAARRWLGLLKKVFARMNVGADFGGRSPKSTFTRHGLGWLEEEFGERVLNDVHGISIYQCEPPPRFAKMETDISVGKNAQQIVSALDAAAEADAVMGDQEQLAYDLYGASFSESSADARLAMLMMAVETLIEPVARATAVREHVDSLIRETQEANLPEMEIASIVGSLQWLRDESISQAGRKLASRLGNRTYMDKGPEAFFKACYALRSRLFHGRLPRPTREEVNGHAGPLERFVADLLSLEPLDRDFMDG
jgi:hypothetical protein